MAGGRRRAGASDAGSRYDRIGRNYAAHRSPDARIEARLTEALGDARTVVNVGAGSGSYEPRDRPVLAVEPSRVMAAQRPPSSLPAVLAEAEELPFADASFDAAMAVLTIHHWRDAERGIAEMARVAGRVVLLTVDVDVAAELWIYRDYLPEREATDREIFPSLEDLRRRLGPRTTITTVPVPHDCSDGFLLSFWAHPERLLDPGARNATSGLALMDAEKQRQMVDRLAADLRSGAWDQEYGHLRGCGALDCGLRLVVAEVGPAAAGPQPPK